MESQDTLKAETTLDRGALILRVKQHRIDNDAVLQTLKETAAMLNREPGGREIALAITQSQLVTMWCGMVLKKLGTSNPYPNSRDTSNTIVDPTADNLKL